jgi:DNA-binding MarR family transcriptional regulator
MIISLTDDQGVRKLGPVSADVPQAHLGYLLKHAQLRFSEISGAALGPLLVNGREAAVLRAIDGPHPLSQGEIARAMNVDRTTMVALIDELEDKGFLQRRQDPGDRRRNVVELTDAGRDTVARAAVASARAEEAFLAPLSADEAEQFRKLLRLLLGTGAGAGAGASVG